MFCSKCGENLNEGTIFCPKCGMNVGGQNNNQNNNQMSALQIIIGGWVALVLGIVGIIYSAITISTDMTGRSNGLFSTGYTYQPPLSGHEITMITILIISIIAAIIGVVLLIKSVTVGNVKNEQTNITGDPQKDASAILSLVLGIVGFFIPVLSSIPGIILGVKGLKSTKKQLAIAGLIISIITLVASIPLVMIIFRSIR